MRKISLTHSCSICPRMFTTEKFADWHIKTNHKRFDGKGIELKKPVEIELEESPKSKGVELARCPVHDFISAGTSIRHKSAAFSTCLSHLFHCSEGCVFCAKCKAIIKTKVLKKKSEIRTWKFSPAKKNEF